MMNYFAFFLRCLRITAVGLLGAVCLLLPAPLPASRPDIVWMAGGHAGAVNAIAFSPDGSMLASGGQDRTLKLWRMPGCVLDRTLSRTVWSVGCIAFSPDGTLLASGSYDDSISIWRVADGALARTLTGHRRGASAVAWSPDGQILASAGGYDRSVRLWRVTDGMLLRSVELGYDTTAIVFLADGASFLVGSSRGRIDRYNVADGVWRAGLTAHGDAVTALALSPDGGTLASSSRDGTAKLWRVSDMQLLHTLDANSRVVNDVAFAPDGKTVGTAGENHSEPKGAVTIWDVEDGTDVRSLGDVQNGVLSLAFSPDGRTLATGSLGESPEGALRLWSMPDCVAIPSPPALTRRAADIAWWPDGLTLAAGSHQALRFWNASDGGFRAVRAFDQYLTVLAFSPDGETCVGGSNYSNQYVTTGTLVFWSPADWGASYALDVWNGVYSLAFSPEGQMLAVGSYSRDWVDGYGVVHLFRVPDRQMIRTLRAHLSQPWAIAFSPDGSILASGADDENPPWSSQKRGSVKLWRVADGVLLRAMFADTEAVVSLSFSPDGRILAAGSRDGTLMLWRVADGVLMRTLTAHTGGAYALGFSKDGLTLMSGGEDGTIKFWRVEDGALVHTYDEETGPAVYDLAVSPDGRRFAYGRSDATVVVARTPALFMAAARLSADGTSASLADAVVSAVFDGHFYAQEADRSSGIRVDHAAEGLIVGQRVRVEGVVGTNANGERFIAANSIAAAGSGEVQPLHVTGKALGGGDIGQPPNGQQGISGSSGLNNIGLLVTTSGRVSGPRVPAGWFYLDDGSGVSDGTGIPGIYVDAGGLLTPPQGSFATVTGVSSCEWFEGRLVNVLRARTQDDIRVHSGPDTPAAQVAGLEMQSNPRHAR